MRVLKLSFVVSLWDDRISSLFLCVYGMTGFALFPYISPLLYVSLVSLTYLKFYKKCYFPHQSHITMQEPNEKGGRTNQKTKPKPHLLE